MEGPLPTRADVVVVGGGHNGLTAAAYLAQAGRSVVVLERLDHLGGAAISARAFPGVDARVSRYSYLLSLMPRQVMRDLGLSLQVQRRSVAAYAPVGDGGLLLDADPARTAASIAALTGDAGAAEAWRAFAARVRRAAAVLFPTLVEPLRPAAAVRVAMDDDALWEGLVQRPLGELLEAQISDDLLRGIVLTDALIGTFAAACEASLRQNRCFLYHVIGGGTGDWDVPVGGMGAVSGALADAARAAGARLVTRAEVVAIDPDGAVDVRVGDGATHRIAAGHVLAGVAPHTLGELLGEPLEEPRPEGAQLKVNMLLERLPRLRDPAVSQADAFTGTFRVHEAFSELELAQVQAAAGQIPAVPPSEIYCHSVSDPSILGPELRAAEAHTLTLFGLHMPARLFANDHDAAKEEAVAATLAALDSVLAEPIADCLWTDADGRPCLEASTPPELERALGLPGGNIFHRDLSWPWAEDEADVGRWGVETAHPRVLLCGAGARRGGGVSGIGGHNAAMALLTHS